MFPFIIYNLVFSVSFFGDPSFSATCPALQAPFAPRARCHFPKIPHPFFYLLTPLPSSGNEMSPSFGFVFLGQLFKSEPFFAVVTAKISFNTPLVVFFFS